MNRLAAACLMTLLMAAPALGQENEAPNPLDVLLDAFDTPEGAEFTSRFLREPTGAGSLVDPVGDFEHSSGEPPGYTPGHIDILSTWAVELDPGPVDLFGATDSDRIWAPTGSREIDPPGFEPFHTFTGDQVHDGTQYESGAVLFGFTLVDTPPPAPPGRCEYVVWINDSTRPQTFVRNPNFPLDPAGDTNLAFGLGLNPEGGPGLQSAFALELQEGGGFAPNFEADIRAFITPRYVGITVPRQLLGEIAAVNFYTFCVEEDFGFEAGISGADQTGLVEFIAEQLGSVEIEVLDVPISTTTTEPATTTTTSTATTTTLPVADSPDEEDGFPWWFVLIGGGLALALAGWWIYGREDDPCKELLEQWMAADEACQELRDTADEAANDCEIAELELAGLEDERKEICRTWPPVCWETEEGDWIEDERGNRITSRDIHMRRVALGDVWADYRAGKLSAGEVETRWREMDTPEFRAELRDTDAAFKDLLDAVDDDIAVAERILDETCAKAEAATSAADQACEKAEQARHAYERCVQRAAAATTDGGTGAGATVGDGSASAASSPGGEQREDPCAGRRGEREARPAGDPEKTLVFVDFSVITGVSEGSERNVAAGTQLALDLNDLATELDFAGDLMTARSAGLHVGGALNGYATGKYVVASTGVVRGGIEAAMATTDVVPDVPTTPVEAGLEGLEGLARLGTVIASKVTEWMTNVQLMTVRLTMFYQDITATPFEIWECTGDRGWVCVERIWEIEVSRLKRLLGQDRSFTVNSPVRRREFQRVIQGLSHRAATTIRRDAESLARWRTEHEPGPCR